MKVPTLFTHTKADWSRLQAAAAKACGDQALTDRLNYVRRMMLRDSIERIVSNCEVAGLDPVEVLERILAEANWSRPSTTTARGEAP